MGSEELILEVGGEGGSLSIWSLGIEGSPERFVVRRNEAAFFELLDEEDQRACRSLQNRTLR